LNGIHIVENLKLEQFSAARAGETAFIMEPLKIKAAPARLSRPSLSAEGRSDASFFAC
jgi:hypothetical protein